MRVAVTQFATSPSTEENISTCLKVIAKTATCKPDIIVLPEFFFLTSEPIHPENCNN
jgi:predicted amidohydrolase